MTAGVIHGLYELGLSVPGDISVVGSDGYALGTMSCPQFDSVAHPILELVDLALARLMEIAGTSRPQSPRQIILRPYVIERASVRHI